MASGVTVANAFVQVMPSMEGAGSSLTSALSGAMEGAGDAAGKSGGASMLDAISGALGGLGERVASVGGEAGEAVAGGFSSILSGGGGAEMVAAGMGVAAAVGAALMSVGGTFDEMTDEIIVGTGASGDALQGLSDVATNIGTSVPTSFANAGDIVQEFNTRMGLSGDTLQEVGSKAASLQNIVGSVNFDNLTGAFNEWGISGEQAGAKMDYLFGVVQTTGIGFDSLVSVVQTAGPAMQELGFSFEDTADMAGMLDKAGLNASGVMGSMKKALSSVAEQGGDVKQAFRDSVDAIQGYIDAGDDAAAINAAKDIFGARNAPQFVAALKSGAINLDELGQAALGAQGDIEGTEQATMDWPEQWQLIQNNVQAALAPLGSAVWSAATAGMQGLSDAMTWLGQAAQPVMDVLGPMMQSAMEQLSPVMQPLVDALGNLGMSILPVVSGAFQLLAGVLQVVGAVLQVVWSIVSPIAQTFASVLAVAIDGVAASFTALGAILSAIGGFFQVAASVAVSAWQGVQGILSGISSAIGGFFQSACAVIGGAMQAAASVAQGAFQGAQSVGSSVASAIGGFFSSAGSAIGSRMSSAAGAAQSALRSIASVASNVVSSIGQAFSGVGSTISGALSRVRSIIQGAFSGIHIPTFHVSGGFNLDPGHFQLPSISFYARGGITNGAAVIGEAGREAIVPYTNSNIRPWARALADAAALGAGGGTTVNQYVRIVRDDEDLYSAATILNRSALAELG
ncbi:phage tail tape measure protein [Olsenella profusa]|uniref:Phage tail tape measure protein domain-containing protein n=1 Tax=Olsenella profusa F0195 TaxID=1125712 RepID=U2V5W0_9ACTN|nr:phage tail tape measure protein [Olsenella profusa]ERL08036.1 hypothetical protein HMPREF1316_2361 [Olsenella profusa F0195]